MTWSSSEAGLPPGWDTASKSTAAPCCKATPPCLQPQPLLIPYTTSHWLWTSQEWTPRTAASQGEVQLGSQIGGGPRGVQGRGEPGGAIGNDPVVVVEDEGCGLPHNAEGDPEDEVADLIVL